MSNFYTIFILVLLITFGTAVQIKLHYEPTTNSSTSGLIWYKFNKTGPQWSEQLDNYLEVYRTPALTDGRSERLVDCSYDKPITDNTVCKIKPDMKHCTGSNKFGYRRYWNVKPCVFIEFDKILDWKPKFYNSTKSLPKDMPSELKDIISESANTRKWETVWIWCEGETPADKEFVGPISYYPKPGFPAYMFPYSGQPGYLSPLVAVHFEEIKRGVVTNVICKLWGPNILHDYNKQIGLVRFSFLIDF